MNIQLTRFLSALSRATDYVEAQVLNVPHYHGRRVAVLTNRLARRMGMDEELVYGVTQAAVLHDCALTEYLEDELSVDGREREEMDMSRHCLSGEKLLYNFPFYRRVRGAVLYHHDRADGAGAMGKRADETPIYSQLIHIADRADVSFGLSDMTPEKHRALMDWIRANSGTAFAPDIARLFTEAVDYELLKSVEGERCIETLEALLPDVTVDVPIALLREMSSAFGFITDYKSHFTWRHSLGIADKAERMGQFYGCSREECDKLYIAGALHDIGKLLISNDILEKPGRLTPEEYREITNHAIGTWELLHGIGGMEDITRWAALHHEKLDGSGYPFGYRAADLGRNERLMACLDIYQALVEERPYKSGMSHEEAIAILRPMGEAGQLDTGIIDDIDACYALHRAKSDARAKRPEARQRYAGEAWRCPVSGYVHEGPLPRDIICPRCEQPGSVFERVG